MPFLDPVVVVADQIAFDRDGPRQNLPVVVGPGNGFRGVVRADRAAEQQRGVFVHVEQCRIKNLTAHIVEIKIDALRAGGADRRLHVTGGAVVDAVVKTQLIDDPLALLLCAGDANNPQAHKLRNLSADRAHGARGRAHQHGLSGLCLPDIRDGEVGGEPNGAENVHVIVKRKRIVVRHLGAEIDGDGAVGFPSAETEHIVTGFNVVAATLQHFANHRGAHGIAKRDRW